MYETGHAGALEVREPRATSVESVVFIEPGTAASGPGPAAAAADAADSVVATEPKAETVAAILTTPHTTTPTHAAAHAAARAATHTARDFDDTASETSKDSDAGVDALLEAAARLDTVRPAAKRVRSAQEARPPFASPRPVGLDASDVELAPATVAALAPMSLATTAAAVPTATMYETHAARVQAVLAATRHTAGRTMPATAAAVQMRLPYANAPYVPSTRMMVHPLTAEHIPVPAPAPAASWRAPVPLSPPTTLPATSMPKMLRVADVTASEAHSFAGAYAEAYALAYLSVQRSQRAASGASGGEGGGASRTP